MGNKIVDELSNIYNHRNVLKSLVVKHLFGVYKNSFLGFAWHFVMPVIMLFVYYIAFSALNKNSIDYFWIYLGVGIFPFTFMIGNLTTGTGCITSNGDLINKIYFPREILVLAQVISSFIIMCMGLSVVLVLMLIVGFSINLAVMPMIVVIIVLMFIFVLGYVLLFSSLNVYARDVQFFLNSVNMIFFFLTPMYFTVESTSGMLSTVIWINPYTYYIEGFHDIIYRGVLPSSTVCIGALVYSSVAIIIGLIVFKKLKKGFAERM